MDQHKFARFVRTVTIALFRPQTLLQEKIYANLVGIAFLHTHSDHALRGHIAIRLELQALIRACDVLLVSIVQKDLSPLMPTYVLKATFVLKERAFACKALVRRVPTTRSPVPHLSRIVLFAMLDSTVLRVVRQQYSALQDIFVLKGPTDPFLVRQVPGMRTSNRQTRTTADLAYQEAIACQAAHRQHRVVLGSSRLT